ncbi:mannitol dehydrogenase family protein [Tateyamaria omphalii]|uniref:mannitol dehydrogenase family protein n=1 Tax=Tateyamaria omphalii TaxID=299262 RepID=UPI001C99F479|nr:mannitol dehydrogenase family protein [Tateyamaria omphalii]MBY5933701.1 mannitol dehydrogenase family protein [Tateyamaria omphalii]
MPRILHLGVGNFFRAHAAAYTQDAKGWEVTGVSFRSPTIRDGLEAQDYTYALVIKDAKGSQIKPITCLTDMLVAPEDPDAVIAAIASEAFDVITLTVTEKAYHLDCTGTLDLTAPEIQADLAGGTQTVVASLACGLAQRTAPVTVLCCDNLPDNGQKLEAAVRLFSKEASLIPGCKVTFPSCMVDRITPATTDAIRQEANDPMAVPTEAFTEWVIEDNFAAARPDWPGVQWVRDVAPHEARKLRMLNGAHSYLAYAGTLRGHSFVHEAIADPELRAVTRTLMQEAAETLPSSVQDQTHTYAEALVRRFENPNLHHKLRQIAMDGSQKLPIRILSTLSDRKGQDSPALRAAVEAWLAFVQAEVAAGRALDDPNADRLVDACKSADPNGTLRELIGA